MMKAIAGVSQMPKSKGAAKKMGDMESIHVERAKNGFSVSCRYKAKESKKNEPMPYMEPEQYVFKSAEEVATFMEHALGVPDKDE